MDVTQRIKDLLEERKWTQYKLAKECGLSTSTISNMFKRNTSPTIFTVETICHGFGITLSQFFNDGEELVELNKEQKELFDKWLLLTRNQKQAILNLINSISEEK